MLTQPLGTDEHPFALARWTGERLLWCALMPVSSRTFLKDDVFLVLVALQGVTEAIAERNHNLVTPSR
jgi:hypothetical protein